MTELHLGNNLDILPTLAENSVDSCVTDPPYLISFMGQKWDSADGIAGKIEVWQACIRVLKPGGYLLAFGANRTYHRMACAIEDAGFEVRDMVHWLFGSGFPKNSNTQLKPAHEPIVLAQKPFSGPAKTNVERIGTGFLNIENCRIGFADDIDKQISCATRPNGEKYALERNVYSAHSQGLTYRGNEAGRYPANVIHDGSEEVVAEFQLYGERKSGGGDTKRSGNRKSAYGMGAQGTYFAPSTGSAARFFYAAKASPSDREPFNTHPTVKPTALMRYLCRLVTPVGGIILDPFMGSGSTGKAALLEGYSFVGIEQNEEYMSIARRRIDGVRDLFTT